jgi:voltage-gated sodium channel
LCVACAKAHIPASIPGAICGLYDAGAVVSRCAQIARSTRFQGFIFGVIVVNAIVLGLQTYDGIEAEAGTLLMVINEVCVGIFLVELTIRIAAYGRRPQDFFRDGWNVFDFVVILAAFAPGLRQNTTLLRLARLLRVVRIVSVLPEFRILVRGMVHSLPPMGSIALLAVLLMYVYGMVGWILFHDQDPENWGTIGDSMLNLFVVMTLEDWPALMDRAQEIHSWSWIFFVSYVLLASFLLFNVLIAVILASMETARAEDRRAARALRRELRETEEAFRDQREELVEAMGSLRDAMDELEERIHTAGDGAASARTEANP